MTNGCEIHVQRLSLLSYLPPISDLWDDYEVYSHYLQPHSSCYCHAKNCLTQFDGHCDACKEFCVQSNALHQYVPWCCVAPVLLIDTASGCSLDSAHGAAPARRCTSSLASTGATRHSTQQIFLTICDSMSLHSQAGNVRSIFPHTGYSSGTNAA